MSLVISLAGVGLAVGAISVRSERVALGLALVSALCIGSAITLEVPVTAIRHAACGALIPSTPAAGLAHLFSCPGLAAGAAISTTPPPGVAAPAGRPGRQPGARPGPAG